MAFKNLSQNTGGIEKTGFHGIVPEFAELQSVPFFTDKSE